MTLVCDQPTKISTSRDEALVSETPLLLTFKVGARLAPLPPHIVKAWGKKAAKADVHEPEPPGGHS